MDNVHTLPVRGKTWLGSSPDRTIDATMKTDIEGSLKVFDDVDPTTTSGAKMRRSNKDVVCMLVRNVGAAVLLPKRIVKYKTGQINRQVDGYCAVTNEYCAGVVDEFLTSAGAPINDLFWITVKGPTLVITPLEGDATNVINQGDILGALTAATSGATTSGRPRVNALTATSTGTTDGAQGNSLFNSFARALSAKTEANTNADLLVETFFLK